MDPFRGSILTERIAMHISIACHACGSTETIRIDHADTAETIRAHFEDHGWTENDGITLCDPCTDDYIGAGRAMLRARDVEAARIAS